MRAFSDNEDLALLSGINPEKVVTIVWVLVAILATVSGTLYGLDKTYKPFTYFMLLLPMFAAAIVGGLGNLAGHSRGFVIAFSEIFVTYAFKKFFGYIVPEDMLPSGIIQIISTDYKFAVSFTILVLVLLFRPTGIFKDSRYDEPKCRIFFRSFFLLVFVGMFQSWTVAFSFSIVSDLCDRSRVNIQWGYAGLFSVGTTGFVALGGVAAVVVNATRTRGMDNRRSGLLTALVFAGATIVISVLLWKSMAKGRIRGFVVPQHDHQLFIFVICSIQRLQRLVSKPSC